MLAPGRHVGGPNDRSTGVHRDRRGRPVPVLLRDDVGWEQVSITKPIALRSQEFIVHGRLFTVNGERKLNRFARASQVKTWREAAKSVALHPSNGPLVPFRHVHVEAEVWQHSGTLGDAGGHAPVVKAVLDGLVDAGVLADDSGSYVERITYHAPCRTAQRAHVRLTLTEIA